MRRFLILFPLCISLIYAQSIDTTALTGYRSIRPSDLENHLNILTSDSLEGRETSYPGQKKAAQYIAGIFKKLKLKPFSDDGTYFQHFDVDISRIHPETKIIVETSGVKNNYFWGTNFISERAGDTTITGPAVFVGFTDTELDSASQAKLAGRIVFAFIERKENADDIKESETWWRFRSTRHDTGAIAVLMIPDEEGPATFQYAQEMMRGSITYKGPFRTKSERPRMQQPNTHFIISPALAEDVLRSTGKSLKQLRKEALENLDFTPVFIDDAAVTIHTKVIYETKQTENVIGILPGSDPDLKSEALAFTAHYDHLGKDEAGIIYHGADDNGSGTAGVLELAEAYVKNPVKPKRSLLFLMTTGEEKSLLGSKYYASNPVIPFNQIITGLNMDMIGRIDTIHEASGDTDYIYVIGSDKISKELDSLLNAANAESEQLTLDYKYNDERDPEQFYYRSDHYQFAKNGVPIVFFFDGINADYHKPTDTADKILFNRMGKICRMIYNLGWKLGNFNRLLINKSSQ